MTATLVANIARPISSALSNALSADAVGLLSNYGKLGAAADPDAAIKALFAAGEQGAWYDPSDLTTMFQDRAGTTPVTADGQTVGLILDKSKGLVLGSEKTVNGDFSVGTGWTLSSATITGNALVCNSGAAEFLAVQSMTFVVGKTYEVSITVTSYTSGSVTPSFGVGSNVTGVPLNSANTVVQKMVASSGNAEFRLISGGIGFVGTLDNISVKELSGNHATAPSDAARPLYKTAGGLHWLLFDGVEDSLSTAAINFSSSDEMSMFSGLRRTSSNASIVYELSSTFNSNNGAFVLISGTDGSTTDGYTFKTRGDINTTLGARVNNLTPPNTSVVSASGNISADLTTMRVNAVAGTNGTQDQGIGNLGNYPLYIASRAGVSSPFSGNIYSLIIRGALSTSDEITATETWVAAKSGVTL